jgi:hypothetical protein
MNLLCGNDMRELKDIIPTQFHEEWTEMKQTVDKEYIKKALRILGLPLLHDDDDR